MSFGLHLDETGSSWKYDFVFEAISAVNVRNETTTASGSLINFVLPVSDPKNIIDTTILSETKLDPERSFRI